MDVESQLTTFGIVISVFAFIVGGLAGYGLGAMIEHALLKKKEAKK